MTSKVNLQITSENMTLAFVLQTLITKQSAQISNLVKPSLWRRDLGIQGQRMNLMAQVRKNSG